MRVGEWRDPALGRITVERWTAFYLRGATHKRASTLKRDRHVINAYLLPAIGDVPLALVRPLDIRRIIDPLASTLEPSTIRGIYGVIAAVFRAAVEADVIVASPCRGVKRPTEHPKPKRFLTAAQLSVLAGAIQPSYSAFVIVGGVLGLRFSELAGLQVGDIDFLRRRLTVSRTVAEIGGRLSVEDVKSPSSRRTLALPPFVVASLAEHLRQAGTSDRDAFVFQSPRGGPLRYSAFHRRVWVPAVRAAGLDGFRIHGLRHSAAGLMISADAHPRVIQQRLGHSSITTTMNVYGAVLPTVEDGVTARLERMFSDESGAQVVPQGAGDGDAG